MPCCCTNTGVALAPPVSTPPGIYMDELFEQLQDDTRSFWQSPTAIRRLDAMPPAAAFFRDYVATSTPVIISGGISGWRASRSWDNLASLAGDNPELEVTVDFTPDGRGDCVVDLAHFEKTSHDDDDDRRGACREATAAPCDTRVYSGAQGGAKGGSKGVAAVFVKPEERRMKFAAFVAMLSTAAEVAPRTEGRHGGDPAFRGESSRRSSKDGEVPYLSHQNDSLRQEFPGLMEDVDPFLALAREAFGNEPDAVNLWIGDDRSLSAVHKDHYENMYCVVRGEKHFTLLPPSDVLFLYEQQYPQGRYRRKNEGGGFEVEMEEGTVPWIPVDPAYPDLDKFPLFRHASPIKCCVGPGDILYLPALWYHRVSQKGVTVAVNYWHDMQFDQKYVYYRFLQGLASKCRGGGGGGSAVDAVIRPPVASEVEGGEVEGGVR